MTIEGLERRDLLAVAVFQQGLDSYEGQEDTVLYSRDPDVNFGTEGSISPDQQDSNGVRQGLLKFDDIFGNGPDQIPLGSTINSATLTVDVVNDSNSAMQMSLYRMNVDWTESTATWSTFGSIGGVQASEGEATSLPPDAVLFDPDTTANSVTAGIFDVTTSLEYWSSGADNFGWVIESAATNGWDFRTKESAQAQRPVLTVDFTAPSGAGEVKFLDLTPVVSEGDTGSETYMLDVARVGGTSGAINVNYSITAGSASAGSDFTAASGMVSFADGETLASVPVEVLGDTVLEGNETVTVTLTDGTGTVVLAESVATLTIADDDALINEVLANVSNAVDETDSEYIELIGTPGASLEDYYFVVFEAEEEENGDTTGSATGIADFVLDLSTLDGGSAATFGTNGLLTITPTNWTYASFADPDTEVITTAKLDGVGGVLEDASQTYALIYSPNAAIIEGTDYDTVGAYENATNQAIGTGVGVLDSLPAGAQLVDSVGVVEGGGGDRDRTLASAELGNPGVHVHQPTRINSTSGNVTSDAVSRINGETQPNTIGAWYNGDIGDGSTTNGVIPYENDTFFVSVVTPDGAVLTPGSLNVLRTVFFDASDQETDVAEADGMVTLTIRRTGDLSEDIDVTYSTIDFGSATDGADYTGVSGGVVEFRGGSDAETITISINAADGVAEGFERFRVEITDVTTVSVGGGEYLITNGQSTQVGAVNGEATVTISDANVNIATFQNGVGGYSGTQDAYIDGEQPNGLFGQDLTIEVDQVKGVGEDTPDDFRPQQGLLQFDNLFGNSAGQVPEGSQVFDAFLTLDVTSIAPGADVNFFLMLEDWDEVNASWTDPQGSAGSSIVDGILPDNIEAASVADFTVPDAGDAGLVEIPMNVDTIQSWANGSLDNYGWVIISDSGSLWRFDSSEAFLAGTFRPELTILYTDPVPAEAGTFSLSLDEVVVNEDDTATVTINRIGGSTGAETVDWSLAAGATGDLADLTGSASGSVAFADGQLSATFNVAINDDSLVETSEDLLISISGTGLDFDRDSATLTIRDNDFDATGGDLFLNEIWINSPGNDPPFEFVELKGTAGVSLGSVYYVAIEGLVGDRTGEVEKIVDLSEYSNGSSGFTILTPDAADFGFNVPSGTTQVDELGSIGTENVASQNDSTTYMLLYSPEVDLTLTTFDYDWDDDGALDLLSLPGVEVIDSLGVLVLGAADQIYGPVTNVAEFAVTDPDVDAVSRDRNSTAANTGADWFGGDLFPAGDDYLLYEAAEAFGLPVSGAALTPGEANVGTAVESPLVALTSVVANVDGTLTLTFDGPISQINLGDGGFAGPGGAGLTITDSLGDALPTIDTLPTVTGFGANTLELSFTGAGAVGGGLPDGDYQLNVVGNGIIGNGRAVDGANNGTATGSDAAVAITVSTAALPGDYNNDLVVDAADYATYRNNLGQSVVLPNDTTPGTVTSVDYDVWRANYGQTASASATVGPIEAVAPVVAEAVAAVTSEDTAAAEQGQSSAVADVPSDSVFADLGGEDAREERRAALAQRFAERFGDYGADNSLLNLEEQFKDRESARETYGGRFRRAGRGESGREGIEQALDAVFGSLV